MANRFSNPDIQFCDTTGAPYALGTLSFFVTGSSTPLAVYSDATLSTSLGAVVTLDSAGRAGAIFLQNLTYKVILADANALQIWTQDPVSTSDVTANAQFLTFAGNPNGSVAGTAGSGTVDSSVIWDRTNNILYVCTTTGNAASAVWTAVNTSSQAATPFPQGRLTPTSATPVIAADATGVTAVFYTPYNGNLLPVYNGASMTLLTFAELTLTLTNAAYSANSLFDVFGYSSSGSAAIATGPAWTVAGNYVSAGTLTTGTAARGTGAGTTQLARVLGLWTNAVSITARNGASTVAIAANQGTYLGTIWIDAAAQATSCLIGYGQNRKWGVWNAYNRVPIIVAGGDATTAWTYNTATWRAARAQTANALSVLCGLPEELADCEYGVRSLTNNGEAFNAVGFNSTTAPSGRWGFNGPAGGANAQSTDSTAIAQYTMLPFIGTNAIIALENGNGATATWSSSTGGQQAMQIRATYRG